eukprot:g6311.t1
MNLNILLLFTIQWIYVVAQSPAPSSCSDTIPKEISSEIYDPSYIIQADVNGDGAMDIVSGSTGDKKLAWYANDGEGAFGPQNNVVDFASFCRSAVNLCTTPQIYKVFALDIDDDDNVDLLAHNADSSLSYYLNLDGTGLNFVPRQLLSLNVRKFC